MAKAAASHPKSKAAWAPVVIRLILGIVFMIHGSQKLFGAFEGPGMAGTVGMMDHLGVHPALFWAWVVALSEFLGGLGVFVGFLTGLASLAIVVDMIVAVALIHGHNGFFNPKGFEYNLALIAMGISLIISGPGKLSIDRLIRWSVGHSDSVFRVSGDGRL